MALHTKHIFSKLWLLVIFKTPTDPSATLCWGTIMRHLEPQAAYNQKVSPPPQLHSSPSPAAAPKSLPILTNSSFPPISFPFENHNLQTTKKQSSRSCLWISIGFLPPNSWWPNWSRFQSTLHEDHGHPPTIPTCFGTFWALGLLRLGVPINKSDIDTPGRRCFLLDLKARLKSMISHSC